MKTNIRKHVIIKGRVQGVWFRYSTQQEADANDVTGWVKNRYDGHVEAVFEGDSERLCVDRLSSFQHKPASGYRVRSHYCILCQNPDPRILGIED